MSKQRTESEIAAGKLISAIQKEWGSELGENSATVSEQVMGAAHEILQASKSGTYSSETCEKGPGSGIMGVVGGVSTDPLGNVPQSVKESGNTQGMIGYPGDAPIRPIERRIQPGTAFTFAIYRIAAGIPITKTCNLSLTFDPQPSGQYEVEYSEDEKQCYLNVFRLEQSGSSAIRVRESTTRVTPKTCPGI